MLNLLEQHRSRADSVIRTLITYCINTGVVTRYTLAYLQVPIMLIDLNGQSLCHPDVHRRRCSDASHSEALVDGKIVGNHAQQPHI